MDNSRAAYDLIRDRVNWSLLKHMEKSPAHLKHASENPRTFDSPAMMIGRAVHAIVLEPDKFTDGRAVWDGGERRGKAWLEFRDAHEGCDILTVAECDRANEIAHAVVKNPDAAALLHDTQKEQTILWEDAETGADCKCRVDAVKRSALSDLKTCRDASPRAFARAVAEHGYHGQGAMYRDGAVAAGLLDDDAPVALIAVESEAPYICQVYVLDDAAIEQGRAVYREYLATFQSCRASGVWPGYAVGTMGLSLPRWALPSENDLSSLGLVA